jgi:hypothetical protein
MLVLPSKTLPQSFHGVECVGRSLEFVVLETLPFLHLLDTTKITSISRFLKNLRKFCRMEWAGVPRLFIKNPKLPRHGWTCLRCL